MKHAKSIKSSKLFIPLILCFILLLGVIGGTTAKYISEQEVGGGKILVQQPVSVINRLWQDQLTFNPTKIVVDSYANAKHLLPSGVDWSAGIDIGAETINADCEGNFVSNVRLFQGDDGTAYILSVGETTPTLPIDSTDLFFNNWDNLKLDNVTEVSINQMDTQYCDNMFYFFGNLLNMTTLDWSGSGFLSGQATDPVTGETKDCGSPSILEGLFYNCASLTSLDVPSLNTDTTKNMDCMFQGCSGLTNIDLSNLNTETVTTMRHMFEDCSGLSALDIAPLNTSNVEDMEAMFRGCSGLTALDITTLDTAKVGTDANGYGNMSSMFDGCSGLTSLDFKNFNTANVTGMHDMFTGCTGLTSLDLSTFDTSKVTDMSNMFLACENLKSLNLSSFDTANVQDAYLMFSGCKRLEEVTLGDKFTFVDSFGEGYLPTPDSTYIPGADVKWYAESDYAGYAPADVPNNVADTYRPFPPAVLNHSWKDQLTGKPTSLILDSFDNAQAELGMAWEDGVDIGSSTADGKSAFTDTVRLFEKADGTTYILARRVRTVIFPMDSSHLFNALERDDSITDCSSIDFRDIDTANVTDMMYMFFSCKDLTSLDLTNFDTANVTDMFWMFGDCSGLTSLDLSSFNTANVTNMSFMFYGCSGLTSLDVTNFDTANVTKMDSMFFNCSGLTSLDLTNFDTSNVTDMGYMFSWCSSLTSLDVSNFDTSSVTNMSYMFGSNYGLQEVTLGEKFAFVGTNGYLPTPNSTSIPGADGKWYAASDGTGYAPADIPSNKADTYYAVKPTTTNTFSIRTDGQGNINGTAQD